MVIKYLELYKQILSEISTKLNFFVKMRYKSRDKPVL